MKRAMLSITPEVIAELLKLPENVTIVRAHTGKDIADPNIYLDLVGEGLVNYHEGDFWTLISNDFFGRADQGGGG